MKHLSLKLMASCWPLMVGGNCLGALPGAEQSKAFQPDQWTAVSDEQLDTLRGGFDLGSGLAVSFGIVRSVMVNGDLVHQTSFNLPDVSQISADQAQMASAAIAESGLIQIGPNNLVGSGLMSEGLTGTLIQNSLNDQQIQTLTVVNTSVNSLGLLKAINTQAALNDALLGAMGSR